MDQLAKGNEPNKEFRVSLSEFVGCRVTCLTPDSADELFEIARRNELYYNILSCFALSCPSIVAIRAIKATPKNTDVVFAPRGE